MGSLAGLFEKVGTEMKSIFDLCDFRWPLENPNEEDRKMKYDHRCALRLEHEGKHFCGNCGAYYDE
jgi:hypothetical protein